MKPLGLSFIWKTRLRFYAEASKLYAEGNKLCAKGNKLRAEGNKLWAEAVMEVHGNIKMEWISRDDGYDCKLETGEVFKH